MPELSLVKHYQDTSYGDTWAPYYDEIYETVDPALPQFLAEMAGTPPRALELGIGSGRIAIPLTQMGVQVSGIENSEQMAALLRAKPEAQQIEVTIGDLGEVGVEGTFPLIYLAFNTLFVLTTQERQIDCFQNVADCLQPGGRFVIDAFVPDLTRWDGDDTRMGVSSISSTRAHAYEMSVHHPAEQVTETHVVRRLESGETIVLPIIIRYAWVSEIDLMARLAGLELEQRWGWYDRRPFTSQSGQHVSVYRKP